MESHYSDKSEFAQVPSRKMLPTFGKAGHAPRDYSSGVPKIRKTQASVVATLRENMAELFAFAGRVQELHDRSNAARLAAYISDQGWSDSLGKSTTYRAANGEGPVGTDTLELIARAFELEAWHLLVPNLDPANPPVVLRSQAERELWKDLQEGARRLAAMEGRGHEQTAEPRADGVDRDKARDAAGARKPAPGSAARKRAHARK